ncbi:YihY/virulence factor BrkB family protein [Robiginitalea sp. M366]|uniref:YihY/virulence factor BrkB family protein n=1 Tax=Robiginitalea aestuariiviva TaxID=3036903 RepID=UPI00240DD7F0|nr:YihY/virulence factor BrkB family protein [Robiginitalea aestuariiviva]MDG1573516.1 YihY/virulence factor BrkB family protein [Robiginitalea aestuariiviva]
MGMTLEERLLKLPVVREAIALLKRIQLTAFEGLSLYDLLAMYVRGIIQGALSTRASAIAFSLFMAIFPLLIFLITLIPFLIPYVSLGNQNFDAEFLNFLETFLPTATGDYFSEVYQQIKDQRQGGWLSTSFLISILLMANGVNSIFGGFENSYHIELTRNFFKQYAYALMVGLVLSLLLITGAVAYVYFEFYILGYLTDFTARTSGVVLDEGEIFGARIAKIVFFVLLTYLTTAILYYFGTAEGKKARFFSYGALMTTLLIILTSYLFGIYIDSFARYNELYGALSGLLILMVYIWLNANILLLGFELNATLTYLRKQLGKDE